MTAEIIPFRGFKDLNALVDEWSTRAARHQLRIVPTPAPDGVFLKLEELRPGAREQFFADLRAGNVDPWLAEVFADFSKILATPGNELM